MKIRKGDLVFYYREAWKGYNRVKVETIGLVDGDEDAWYVIENHISIIRGDEMGAIIPITDIFSIVLREDLEEFWRFI